MDRHTQQVFRNTEAERFVAMIKLAGLTILGIVSAVVIAATGLPA
jgi:hypothetical protein